MKVKILQKCFVGSGGNLMAGEEHDLEDRIAEKLIARGFAEAATKKKSAPKKKKTTRAIETLETPEDTDLAPSED
jgi:hypothetical protein